MSGEDDVRVVDVQAVFRHSAGTLGSYFLKGLRDGRIFGWRSGDPARVEIPPRDRGFSGEWVDVGPKAKLEAYAPSEWLNALGVVSELPDSCLALVKLDGADSTVLARVRAGGNLTIGQDLIACFADERTGAMSDLWFEPVKSL